MQYAENAPEVSRQYIEELGLSASIRQRAVADNCSFDERCSTERWNDFYKFLSVQLNNDPKVTEECWGAALKDYMDERFRTPKLSTPDAFLKCNELAWLPAIVGQKVVRLEALTWPLHCAGTTSTRLATLKNAAASNSEARAEYDEFFEIWNSVRDGRPSFCAFPDEIGLEIEQDDWSHAMRDRLGLGHYPPLGGVGIDVALMVYDLEEVIKEQGRRGLAVAASLPHVLDGGMHEFFFPVPREFPFGATLHLNPNLADMLTSEIVHLRIDYKPSHLHKLGRIERHHSMDDLSLAEARDLHLLAVQISCGRDDFGKKLEGRF